MGKWKLKPLVRASHSSAFTKRRGFALSRSLEEELFRIADVLSEGGCRTSKNGSSSYFGSTMITFDLSRLAERGPGKLDDQAYRRLAAAVEGSVRVHLRALRIAYREVVRRVTDRHFGTAQIETVVRLDGKYLHLDVDLEVPLGITSVANSR